MTNSARTAADTGLPNPRPLSSLDKCFDDAVQVLTLLQGADFMNYEGWGSGNEAVPGMLNALFKVLIEKSEALANALDDLAMAGRDAPRGEGSAEEEGRA